MNTENKYEMNIRELYKYNNFKFKSFYNFYYLFNT